MTVKNKSRINKLVCNISIFPHSAQIISEPRVLQINAILRPGIGVIYPTSTKLDVVPALLLAKGSSLSEQQHLRSYTVVCTDSAQCITHISVANHNFPNLLTDTSQPKQRVRIRAQNFLPSLLDSLRRLPRVLITSSILERICDLASLNCIESSS